MQVLGYHDNLLKLAAVVYRSGQDDIDGMLAAFAADLLREGHRIGGVVQRNAKEQGDPQDMMRLIDLMAGRVIPICQELGSGASSCKLDPAGIAEAAVSVSRAIADNVELVVVNKFSKQEAAGGGLRAEIADAVVAGLPILTAVSDKCYDDWIAFTGGFGTTLACQRAVIDDWWRQMSWRESRTRLLASLEHIPAASFDPEPPFQAIGPMLLPYHDIG
jgi:molybdate transport system ATP-binding protein